MTAMRGYADDYALSEWLYNHIFPVEDRFDAECVKICAQIGMAEAISSGTTSISDMYFFSDAIASAAAECGIRANISRSVTWNGNGEFNAGTCPGWAESIALCEKWHNYDSGRIKTDVSVHAEYTSNRKVWETVAAYAREKNLIAHIHLSETKAEHENAKQKYGVTPARLFYDAGILNNRTLAAHCVWLEDPDIELIAECGASVAHNPISNLKLGSGVAPLKKMDAAGINIALGTDGVASNNSHDMFEEIKTAALLQKGTNLDPALFPALKAVKMATVNGARAQGRADCGMIRAGMAADLIMLDASGPSIFPLHDPLSAIAYCARGSDVEMTMVKGRMLYEKREFVTIDWEKLRFDFYKTVAPRLFG
jgi:5-methylthioadenosine/S-adenosylhomocysteine deaminase